MLWVGLPSSEPTLCGLLGAVVCIVLMIQLDLFAMIGALLVMAAMFVASRFPGMEIPFPYWIFGFCTPLCISTPVCIIMNRQAEQKRRLNDKLRAALAEEA